MSDKRFFNTNVLFYAYDKSDPGKQATAQALLLQAAVDANARSRLQQAVISRDAVVLQ
jgi:hypothetical protein